MIDLLLEKLESDSQVFKTVVQNFFKRYAKPSCFSSEENISRNKLSETSAINTFRKMSSFFWPYSSTTQAKRAIITMDPNYACDYYTALVFF